MRHASSLYHTLHAHLPLSEAITHQYMPRMDRLRLGRQSAVKMIVSKCDCEFPQCTMTLDHGAPVEAVTFLPGGSLVATAGGTEIRYPSCALMLYITLCTFAEHNPKALLRTSLHVQLVTLPVEV